MVNPGKSLITSALLIFLFWGAMVGVASGVDPESSKEGSLKVREEKVSRVVGSFVREYQEVVRRFKEIKGDEKWKPNFPTLREKLGSVNMVYREMLKRDQALTKAQKERVGPKQNQKKTTRSRHFRTPASRQKQPVKKNDVLSKIIALEEKAQEGLGLVEELKELLDEFDSIS